MKNQPPSCSLVQSIVNEFYFDCEVIKPLIGEVDYNYLIKDFYNLKYVFKFSRIETQESEVKFQIDILNYLSTRIETQKVIKTKLGKNYDIYNGCFIRMYSYLEGEILKYISPITSEIINDIGIKSGQLSLALKNFKVAERHMVWDIAQCLWIEKYLTLFNESNRHIIIYFITKFKDNLNEYKQFSSQLVQNDLNEANILISYNNSKPIVKSIIDFGDAVKTQLINDVAIGCCYLMMMFNPLEACFRFFQGYNQEVCFSDKEIDMLYTLIGCRLAISLTKSTINRIEEPENEYLFVSEKPAWKLIKYLYDLKEELFTNLIKNTKRSALKIIKKNKLVYGEADIYIELKKIDFSIGSLDLGNYSEMKNIIPFNELKNDDKKLTYYSSDYLVTEPFFFKYNRELIDMEKLAIEKGEFTTLLGRRIYLNSNLIVKNIFFDDLECVLYDDITEICFEEKSLYKYNDEENFYARDLSHLNIEASSYEYKYLYYSKSSDYYIFITSKAETSVKFSKENQIIFSSISNDYITLSLLSNLLVIKNNNCYEVINRFSKLNNKSIIDFIINNSYDPFSFLNFSTENQEVKEHDLWLKRQEFLGYGLSMSFNKKNESNTPIEIERGMNQYLLSSTGELFLDTVNNVSHIGHEHPKLVNNMTKQIKVLNTNSRYLNQNIVKLAQTLLDKFPKNLKRVYFVNSGSEANELAIRLAKNFTNKTDFITVSSGYYGNTSTLINLSSYKFDGKGGKGCPSSTHLIPLPDYFRGKYNKNSYSEDELDNLYYQEFLDKYKKCENNFSGWISESIVGCGGQVPIKHSLLNKIYNFTRSKQGVVISDEVQTGFGRTGSSFWSFGDLIPDVVTIGKPFGNGHPLAAVVCTEEISLKFNNGMEFFSTFGGNPVSCVVGLTVLKIIEEESLQTNSQEVGKYFIKKLLEIDSKLIADVRGSGLFIGVEIGYWKDKITFIPLTNITEYIKERMINFSVLVSVDGIDNNVIKIKPPITFSKSNVDEFIHYLKIIMKENYVVSYENSILKEK